LIPIPEKLIKKIPILYPSKSNNMALYAIFVIMNSYPKPSISTLGELLASGYAPRSVKEELRSNLIQKIKSREPVFSGIHGYEETVIPDLERAILSRHNIVFLGLRGQAKTRIARLMTSLLDEYIPVVKGSELNDDPLNPVSKFALNIIAEMGNQTPIDWMHRSERYTEKLATPDVTVADLIGDADPIKAATLKLPYSDERVIHFGLVPRSNRGIFAINEMPDLQPRIQVALFNILQEGDIKIRGFRLRLPLDIQFVFTANPEDYTNRGSIVTPLKDRIQSQILTHYPRSIELSRSITRQEARIHPEQHASVEVPALAEDLIEQIAVEARQSEYVDAKSGVSARLTISAYENMVSAAERRAIINYSKKTLVRIADIMGVVPAITGKIELVYEGEQEGPANVAQILIGKAIRSQFTSIFPDPDKAKKSKSNPYSRITEWFGKGNTLDLMNDIPDASYRESLDAVPGLSELVSSQVADADAGLHYFLMEFVLHGLAEYSLIGKSRLENGSSFSDLLSGMFTMSNFQEEDDE
jgi:magnesium chelatase subunit I